jgi:hypothetical protein
MSSMRTTSSMRTMSSKRNMPSMRRPFPGFGSSRASVRCPASGPRDVTYVRDVIYARRVMYGRRLLSRAPHATYHARSGLENFAFGTIDDLTSSMRQHVINGIRDDMYARFLERPRSKDGQRACGELAPTGPKSSMSWYSWVDSNHRPPDPQLCTPPRRKSLVRIENFYRGPFFPLVLTI